MRERNSLKGDQIEPSDHSMEDSDPPCNQNLFSSVLEARADNPASKRRKVVPKTVVTVRIESSVGMQKGEGPPSDSWSWRKYGQKPIKGSPYPRGYYRCSTSKGCSAKKQVERCKTDASVLIITYTSTHNHPRPDQPKPVQTKPSPEPFQPTLPPTCNQAQKEDEPTSTDPPRHTDELHLMQESTSSRKEEEPRQRKDMQQFADVCDNTEAVLSLFGEAQQTIAFSTPKKSEENDFFDELEELPISSSPAGMMRNSFFDERILVLPSYSN